MRAPHGLQKAEVQKEHSGASHSEYLALPNIIPWYIRAHHTRWGSAMVLADWLFKFSVIAIGTLSSVLIVIAVI